MKKKNFLSQTEAVIPSGCIELRKTMISCLKTSFLLIETTEKSYQQLLFRKKNFFDTSDCSYKGIESYIRYREDNINSISSDKEKQNCHILSFIENQHADDLLKKFSYSSFSEKFDFFIKNGTVTELYHLLISANEYLQFTLAAFIDDLTNFHYLPDANKQLPLYSFDSVTLLISKNAKPLAYYEPLTHSFIRANKSVDAFDRFFFKYYLTDILALHYTFQRIIDYQDAIMDQATTFLCFDK